MKHIPPPERSQNLIFILVLLDGREARPLEIRYHFLWLQLVPNQCLDIMMPQGELVGRYIRRYDFLFPSYNFDRFDRVAFFTVLREGPNDGVEADIGLGSAEGSHLDQHVLGVDGDLGEFAVDDGRH